MQVIEIEESLMTEVCEAANFEDKSCSEYIKGALHEALRRTENKRLEPEKIARTIESFRKFPQEFDDSDEEFEHWRKVYGEFERSSEK